MAKRRGRPPKEPTTVEVVDAPPLLATHDSVQGVLAWATRALLNGDIPDTVADKITRLCSAMTTSLRQKHAEQELFEAKEILAELEETERRIHQAAADYRKRGIPIDEVMDGE